MKMVEGFLLYGVDGEGARAPIDVADKCPVDIVSAAAYPSFAGSDETMMGTEPAFHRPIVLP